ncbi:MAG: hypothetical protein V4760_09625 [Bdellovibrionota bacterium]
MKSIATRILIILLVVAVLGLLIMNYSFVFAKSVEGRIIGVDRVTQPAAVITSGQMSSAAMFSFAVAIEDEESKKVFTASSEDRQWGVAQHCGRARAKFYPYPPWDLEKAGTFYNARLIELYDCKQQGAPANPPAEQPATEPTPAGP